MKIDFSAMIDELVLYTRKRIELLNSYQQFMIMYKEDDLVLSVKRAGYVDNRPDSVEESLTAIAIDWNHRTLNPFKI